MSLFKICLRFYFEICFFTLPFLLLFSEPSGFTKKDYERLSHGKSLYDEEKKLKLNREKTLRKQKSIQLYGDRDDG